MQNSLEVQGSCDVSILLKSKKEHYQKQMEKLISYIGEEFRINDPLSLIGKRFREKEEEFSSLRRENQELLQRTKHLAEDIQRLRVSQDNSLPWEDLHISLERTQKVDNLLASKEVTSQTDYLRPALEEIDSRLEQARQEGEEEAKQYDRVLEWAITYLTRDKAAWRLTGEMLQGRQEGSGEEMVLVPRKRYEQLITIYSINIAEISINELRQKKNVPAGVKQQGINYIEESKRTFHQKYADIARDVDVKDLHQLFQELAKKVGFEGEWQRYHLQNANEAVNFQGRVNSIFEKNRLGKEEDGSQQEKPLGKYQFGQMLRKLNRLVKELPFERAERREWEQLNEKIKEDRLVDLQSLTQRYQQMVQKEASALIANVSTLLQATVTQSLQEFSKIVKTKLRVKDVSWGKEVQGVSAPAMAEAVEDRRRAGGELWAVLREVVQQKIKEIYSGVGKRFVFLSGATLYQASNGRK